MGVEAAHCEKKGSGGSWGRSFSVFQYSFTEKDAVPVRFLSQPARKAAATARRSYGGPSKRFVGGLGGGGSSEVAP